MYFDKPGKENTEQTLKLAFQKGQQVGINELVVASTTGATAYKALEICKGFKLPWSLTIADSGNPLRWR
jgi:uncharacterized protein